MMNILNNMSCLGRTFSKEDFFNHLDTCFSCYQILYDYDLFNDQSLIDLLAFGFYSADSTEIEAGLIHEHLSEAFKENSLVKIYWNNLRAEVTALLTEYLEINALLKEE